MEFPKGWCDIDVSVQESIQLAYDAGRPTVVFSVLQSSRLGLWRHYKIDFSRMEQENVNSGRIRNIRLSPGDANATLALEDVKRKRSQNRKMVHDTSRIFGLMLIQLVNDFQDYFRA